jgi:hypothetical protein
MTIRAKAAPRRVMHIDLEPGSLFVMSYATQLHYTHGVPKTPNQVGERISLAFRVKPPRVAEAEPDANANADAVALQTLTAGHTRPIAD